MTPAIPPDAKRVVLAAVVPCEQCLGTGTRHCGVEDCSSGGEHPCTFCLSSGTRTIVTDIEVEPVRHWCDEDYNHTSKVCSPDEAMCWRPKP